MPTSRYILLLVVTTCGGILSGILWLIPNGLMAGAMAFCFSLGTIGLAERERRNPGSVGMPEALVAGMISGMVAALPLLALEFFRPQPRGHESTIFKPPALDNWYLIAAPILYGVVLHFSVQRGMGTRHPVLKSLAWACLLMAFLRTVGFFAREGFRFEALIPVALIAVFQTAPFAILWVSLTSKLHPRWKPASRMA